MVLAVSDIRPGAIAWFDAAQLNRNVAVDETGSSVEPKSHLRPFVCYWASEAESSWAPLTSVYKDERLPIDTAWLQNAFGKLRNVDQYLQDGRNTYTGPHDAFVDAAATENVISAPRPCISEEGVAKILDEVRYRGGEYRD